ncbi:MAG TPA: MIP/aquaporin family protein, partial [Chloroflexota bacterium]|nr:MIP/aquaporin family protein [Chloroflexota bacterium]
MKPNLRRQCLAEFIGTALLLAAVVGSGIAAQRLSPSDVGLQLLENALVTGAALAAIILALGPVSGAHLNPAVSLADALLGGLPWRSVVPYALAQLAGAAVGVVLANLMFGLQPISISTHQRLGPGLWLGEVVATFGLLLTIFGVVRSGRSAVAPVAVGAYITAAYWFTSSTSFANPAVTIARMLSDTFAGISPASVLPFIAAQALGLLLGV